MSVGNGRWLRILKPAPGVTALSSELQQTNANVADFSTVCLDSTCRHPAGGHAGAEEPTRAVVRRGNRPGVAICSESSCSFRTPVQHDNMSNQLASWGCGCASCCRGQSQNAQGGPACGHRPVACPRADAAASAAAAAAAAIPGGMPATAPPQLLVHMTAPTKTGMTPVLHHTPLARAADKTLS